MNREGERNSFNPSINFNYTTNYMDRGLRYRCGIESANDVLWMSDLCCNGDESSILECPGAQLGLFRSECAGKGFAAVACLSEVKRIHVYI